jgi:hypothetical protein
MQYRECRQPLEPDLQNFLFIAVECVDSAFHWHNDSIDVALVSGVANYQLDPFGPSPVDKQDVLRAMRQTFRSRTP